MLDQTRLDPIKKIAFIGAGNMSKAIIDGLIKSGLQSDKIFASARSHETRVKVAAEFSIATGSNEDACKQADVVILSVKPQMLKEVCAEIRPMLGANTLVISVAAGISCASLEAWLGQFPIVRCMPNTPCAVGLGASGLYANQKTNEVQKEIAKDIMSAVGLALYVDKEALIDAVIAVSGSGPAYFFLFIEAMIQAGTKLGLDASTAAQLAKQTALGASSLASQSPLDVDVLRKNVMSPNGTTERAIQSFESSQLRNIVETAMTACAERAKQLAIELGEK